MIDLHKIGSSFDTRPSDMDKEAKAIEGSVVESDQGSTFSQIDPAIEKRALFKFDSIVVSMVGLIYFYSNLDKSNIGNAAVSGMLTDLNLKGTEYNNIVSLLYVTYCVFEAPVAIMLKKVGPRNLLAFMVTTFGISSLCTAFVKNYGQLVACRLLVGLFEAGVVPGYNVYFSMIYTRKEMAKRASIIYTCGAIAGAFGGLLAYGILHMDGIGNWAGWRWLFALEGAATVLAGPLTYILLPAKIEEAWFLNAEEKKVMHLRATLYPEFFNKEPFNWKEVFSAWQDWKLWLFSSYQICADVALFGFATFLPSIIKGLGYGSYETQLMTIPVYFVCAASFVIISYFSDRLMVRGPFILLSALFQVFGLVIMAAGATKGIRYWGCFVQAVGAYVNSGLMCIWVNNNYAPHYRRATAVGTLTTVGNVGGVIAGQLYPSGDSPRYIMGLTTTIGLMAYASVVTVILSFTFRNINKKRDAVNEMADLGDKPGDRDPKFRYLI